MTQVDKCLSVCAQTAQQELTCSPSDARVAGFLATQLPEGRDAGVSPHNGHGEVGSVL